MRSYFKQSFRLNCRSFHICLNEEKCDNEIFSSKRLFIWQIIHANARNFRCKFQLESHYASPLDLTAFRAPKSHEIFTAKCRTTKQHHQNTETFVPPYLHKFYLFFPPFYCHIIARLLFEFNSSTIPTIIRYLLLQTLCYCSNHKHKQNEREKAARRE